MEAASCTALVTGGASGLGLATVEQLTAAGAAVLLFDLPGSDGPAIAERLGPNVAFCPGDVRDEDAVSEAVRQAAELGEFRVLVNCAGIGEGQRLVDPNGQPSSLEAFRRVVEVNLLGTFNTMRLAAAEMLRLDLIGEERGVIVNTGSITASDGQIGQAAYSASKAAIAGMALPLARDLAGQQIRVVTIAPGFFATPMLERRVAAEGAEVLAGQIPHPSRLGTPAEFAQLVGAIVATPMLNGETIRLDGATRMPPR